MQCPFCQHNETKVIDSREVAEGCQTRRRRECLACSTRFTTYEKIELSLPRLIKKDGSYVQFKEEKLRGGILRSLEKRPIETAAIDKIVNTIIARLRASGEQEISTQTLGSWVMAELKQLDQVAYVRFASVYRRFEDIEAFKEEIAKLSDNKAENTHLNTVINDDF